MGFILELRPSHAAAARDLDSDRFSQSIRTSEVHVVLTSIGETMAAVRVGSELAWALDVPLTIVHLRAVPYPVPVDHPADLSPVETDAFVERMKAQGLDVELRVYLCRSVRRAITQAF